MKMKILTALLLFSLLLPGDALGLSGETEVPIIMYHKVTGDSAQQGKYAISPEEFEADLLYLRREGYQTVTMADLIAYVQEGTPLPEKPVVLTFDDGYFSDYHYVWPLLGQYEMRAVLSIIGKITDEYTQENRQDINYPHLTWFQVEEMAASGWVEIQNHGYDLHCEQMGVLGAQKRAGESDGDYARRLGSDLSMLQNRAHERLGVTPTCFTYPFGAKSEISDDTLRELGFSASLMCESRRNILTVGEPDCLFSMGRIIRPHGTSLEDILED